jgi:hypothetical protein
MSLEKQELLKSIETLPEEIVLQVLDYMEYLKFNYIINQTPEELIIKDKENLKKKLEEGLKDIENGNVCSLDEAFLEIEKSL